MYVAYVLFIFKNINHVYVSIFYEGCIPVNSGWRTSSGVHTTILEPMM
jgi:hypothetical protein